MCELFAEMVAPGDGSRRVWRWIFWFALIAIFGVGMYLAIDAGVFRSQPAPGT